MAAAKCIDTSSLEVMYSAKEERVFNRDLTDEILHMVFDKWWIAMNVETKNTIAWSMSRLHRVRIEGRVRIDERVMRNTSCMEGIRFCWLRCEYGVMMLR